MSWGKNLFILIYLSIQLLLPLRGVFQDKVQSRADFSWNMYSVRYDCQAAYLLTTPDGETKPMPYHKAFYRWDRVKMIFRQDRLPYFHAWLCDGARQNGVLGSIRAKVQCAVSTDEYLVDLVNSSVDLCTAPNYGVILH